MLENHALRTKQVNSSMPPVKLSLMSATPSSVHIARCLWQRHQEAACNYCLNACPSGALQFSNREIHLNEDRCLGCGVCLSVCPVECFETEDWSERSLITTLQRLKTDNAEIACRLHPSPQEGTEPVPVLQLGTCIAAISPGLWFEIGLEYNLRLHLDACSDCPISHLSNYARQAILLANSWLQSCERPARLEILDTPLPEPALNKRRVISAERPILNRRDFLFAFARSSGSPNQAFMCLPDEISETTSPENYSPHQPAWLRRLRDIYPVPPNEEAVTGRESPIEEGQTETPRPKSGCSLWPTLSVAENCAACGACARYCPSGALTTKVIDNKFVHIFTPGVCIACGLCAQVCRSEALTRSYSIEANPFEEKVMAERDIGSCRKCGSPALKELDGLCYWCAHEPPMNSLMENARNFLLWK